MSEHIEQNGVVSETETGVAEYWANAAGSYLANATYHLRQFQSGENFLYVDGKSDRTLHDRLAKMLTERDEPPQLFLTNFDEPAPVSESDSEAAPGSVSCFDEEQNVNGNSASSAPTAMQKFFERTPDEVAADIVALIPSKAKTYQHIGKRTPAEVAEDIVEQVIPGDPSSLYHVFMSMGVREFVETTVAALRALGETETVQALLNLLTVEGEVLALLAALPLDSRERKALYSCLAEYCSGETVDDPLVLDFAWLQNACARLIDWLRNNPNAFGVPDNELSQADRELAEVFALVPLPDLDPPTTAPKATVAVATPTPEWPEVLARLDSAKGNG